MIATIYKNFADRWYFVSSRDGVSIKSWRSRSQAISAAKDAGHEFIVG